MGSKHAVGPGSVFVLPTPLRHDLVNVGTETLRAVAFFAAAMFTQTFDNMMLPPKAKTPILPPEFNALLLPQQMCANSINASVSWLGVVDAWSVRSGRS